MAIAIVATLAIAQFATARYRSLDEQRESAVAVALVGVVRGRSGEWDRPPVTVRRFRLGDAERLPSPPWRWWLAVRWQPGGLATMLRIARR